MLHFLSTCSEQHEYVTELSACLWVCMCVCVCLHDAGQLCMHACVWLCIRATGYVCIHVYVWADVCANVQLDADLDVVEVVDINMCVCKYACMHVCTSACMHVGKRVCVCVRVL